MKELSEEKAQLYINLLRKLQLELLQQTGKEIEGLENDPEFIRYEQIKEIFNSVCYCKSLIQELKKFCVHEMVNSQNGLNFSGYKDYRAFLFSVSPEFKTLYGAIQNYINTDLRRSLPETDIFSQPTMEGVGKVLFREIEAHVKGATTDIIKIVIKDLQRYVVAAKRIMPIKEEEYYIALCEELNISVLPKTVYEEAFCLFYELFGCRKQKLYNKIDTLIAETEQKRKELEQEREDIKSCYNHLQLLQKDITVAREGFVAIDFQLKEQKALHQSKMDKGEKESVNGLLAFYKKQIGIRPKDFCSNLEDKIAVEKKLRELTISFVRNKQYSYLDGENIDVEFEPYKEFLDLFKILLADTGRETLYNLFYFVKCIPFHTKIYEEHWVEEQGKPEGSEREGGKTKLKKSALKRTKELIEKVKVDIAEHPMNVEKLASCFKEKRYTDYLGILEQYRLEAETEIKTIINRSACLQKRKKIITDCIAQLDAGNNELVINLLPLQIEGLFFDLLEYSTIYEQIKNIGLYDTTLRLELFEKIQYATVKELNINFLVMAYFKFYFNSVIRNTIAHGNYDMLVLSRAYISSDESKPAIDFERVIALELLYDLYYLILTISQINEIDTVVKIIDNMALSLQEDENEKMIASTYDRLYYDLTERMPRWNINRYKPGIFVNYDSRQLLCWIFNPTYQKYLNETSVTALNKIQEILKSADFWKHVLAKVNTMETPYEKRSLPLLKVAVKTMLSMKGLDMKVITLMVEINKKLEDF